MEQLKLIAVAALALVWFAVSVVEARNNAWKNDASLPPLEYDHPYPSDKLLVVERYETEREIMMAGCPKSPPPWDAFVACADGRGGVWSMEKADFVPGCTIIMGSDAYLRSMHITPEALYRHEIGHCNGWGSKHSGERPYRG